VSSIGSDDNPVFDLFHAEFLFDGVSICRAVRISNGKWTALPHEKRGPGEFSIFASPLLANSTPSPCYLLVTSLTSVLWINCIGQLQLISINMKTVYRVLIGVIPPLGNKKVIFMFKNIFIQGKILYFSSSISTGIKS